VALLGLLKICIIIALDLLKLAGFFVLFSCYCYNLLVTNSFKKGAIFMLAWKRVFFDLDNTLYSHEYAFQKAIQDCYQDLVEEWIDRGIQLPQVLLEDWFDVFKYYSDFFWEPYEQKELSQVNYRRKRYMYTMKHFELPCSEKEADKFHIKYYEQANRYVQPFPGLYQLLQYLQDCNVKLGIITNGKRRTQQAKFEKLKLYRFIQEENFYISEVIGKEKPDTELFTLALESDLPAHCLFIGDAWEHDIVGSIEAGWQAIYLNTQNKPRTTIHEPLVELSHFTQLLPFIKKN
jgi:5'-nucleotidase